RFPTASLLVRGSSSTKCRLLPTPMTCFCAANGRPPTSTRPRNVTTPKPAWTSGVCSPTGRPGKSGTSSRSSASSAPGRAARRRSAAASCPAAEPTGASAFPGPGSIRRVVCRKCGWRSQPAPTATHVTSPWVRRTPSHSEASGTQTIRKADMKRTDCNVLAFVATLGMVLAGCKDRGPANAIAATAPAGGAGGGPASPGLQVPAEAFTLRLNSRLALGGHSLVANVEATLAASTAWKRGDEIWRSFRLTSPKVLLAAGKDEQKELPGLERPFALRFSKTGSLEELAVHEDIPVETRRVLQTLAGFFQFVCTEDEASKRWTVLENDGTGSYRASYERDDNGWVTKNKLSYDGDLVIRLRVERSQSSYRARCNE